MAGIVGTLPPFLQGGLSLQLNFQKGGRALQDLNFQRGVVGKEGVTFFRGGCNFHKNKLKSEIFNDKKSL